MNNALRADVHVGAGRHLAVLAHAQGVELLPVVGLRVVRDDHAVGDDHPRGILVAREEAQRMAGVHHERLLVRHRGEVLHHEAVLRPVLEDGAVAAVDDELVRVLGHARIQVVLDHRHDGRRLPGLGRILVDGPGVHLIGGTETVHIDASVLVQLLGEFLRQHGVMLGGEVAQRILQRQHLLLVGQDILPLGGVVDLRIIRLHLRQLRRNARQDFLLKLIHSHYVVLDFSTSLEMTKRGPLSFRPSEASGEI